MDQNEAVRYEARGSVAWITMDQPQSMNSLTKEISLGLEAAIAKAEADPAVRAVVLTGSGKAFCAGGDLRAIGSCADVVETEAYMRGAGVAPTAIFHSKKPYIAAVNGAAAGAGFNLAITCDFVLASSKAKFTQAFSSVGLMSDCGGNFLLPRLVGPQKAKELMMLPLTITAQEAKDLGIVSRVVEPEQLEAEAEALAASLAERPPLALAQIKRFVNESMQFDFDTMRTREEKMQGILAAGEDAKEGIAAFFEKRQPVFKGNS